MTNNYVGAEFQHECQQDIVVDLRETQYEVGVRHARLDVEDKPVLPLLVFKRRVYLPKVLDNVLGVRLGGEEQLP